MREKPFPHTILKLIFSEKMNLIKKLLTAWLTENDFTKGIDMVSSYLLAYQQHFL